MPAPFFSIIIPCFNHAHFLIKAVESIQAQDFSDWEVIIINDGSSDQTEVIAENFRTEDERIKVITQPNSGLSAARNAGIKLAKGEVFNFLDADDWLLPNCLKVVFEKMQDSNLDILVSGYSYFKESDVLHTHRFKLAEIPIDQLIYGNIAPPVAFFARKEVVKTVGEFDVTLKSCEDWDYWIRAAKSGFQIHSIPEVLVGYRFVYESMSRKPKQMYEALLVVSKRAIGLSSEPRKALEDQSVEVRKIQAFAKPHFLTCLGVSLFQGKLEESVSWFYEEREKFDWEFSGNDWSRLSSNLSFKYFLTPELLDELLTQTWQNFNWFFSEVGYSKNETRNLLNLVFRPQLMKKNHLIYGKILGSVLNRIGIWTKV